MLIRNFRNSWSLLGLIFLAVISLKILVQMLSNKTAAGKALAKASYGGRGSADLGTIWLVEQEELVRKKVRYYSGILTCLYIRFGNKLELRPNSI